MEATARMKEGLDCDLLARLAAQPAFGMSIEEMETALAPEKYTGRCGEQVERYVAKLRPLLAQAAADKVELEV